MEAKRIDSDWVILAELLATAAVVLWALIGPGAGRPWSDQAADKED